MHVFRKTSTWVMLTVAAFTLIGCDSKSPSTLPSSSSSQSSVTYSSVQASDFGNVQVHFPPPASSVTTAEITVRGTILDTATVATLTVNGTAIDISESNDWQIPIALEHGENSVLVESTDTEGTTNEIEFTVERSQSPIRGNEMARDPISGTLYVVDRLQNEIFSYNPTNWQPVPMTIEGEVAMESWRHLEFDWHNNRLILAQIGDASLLTIDVTDGTQSTHTIDFPDDRDRAETPTAMAFDGTNLLLVYQELIKLDQDGERLPVDAEEPDQTITHSVYYNVNPNTWQASVLAEYAPDNEVNLYPVRAMTSAAEDSYLYASDYSFTADVTRLIKIDKNSGEVSAINLVNSDGDAVVSAATQDLLSDPANQRLLQLAGDSLLSIDLESGTYRVVSSNSTPAEQSIRMLAIDRFAFTSDEAVTYFDDATDQLVHIDLESGSRTHADETLMDLPAPYVAVNDLALDLRNQFLYAVDSLHGVIAKHNLVTGEKSIVIDATDFVPSTPAANPDTYNPRADRNNPINTPRFAAVSATGTLVTVDSADPKITSLTDEGEDYTAKIEYRLGDNTFVDFAVDDLSGTFYLVQEPAIYTYRLGMAQSTPLENFSGGSIPSDNHRFITIRALAVDKLNDRLLAADSSLNAIVAVDLQSGERSIFSPFYATGDDEDSGLSQPSAIAVHNASEQAFLVDGSAQGIFSLNLEDGSKQRWLDLTETQSQGLANPLSMTLHPFYHYILLFDEVSHRIIAVDIPTKQIVTLSR